MSVEPDIVAVEPPVVPEESPRPRAWIAAVLTWLAPGLGQAYAGAVARGIWICLAVTLVSIGLLLLEVRLAALSGTGFMVLVVFTLAIRIWVMVDAMRIARHPAASRSPHWGVILASAVVYGWLLSPVPRVLTQAFTIVSGTMIPTLLTGDHLLADMTAYGVRDPLFDARLTSGAPPQRGDIAVFAWEGEPGLFVFRIVGLPGEEIAIRDKQVYIDGTALAESYVVHGDPEVVARNRDQLAPLRIPPGRVFVMGDNRDRSYDSRFRGTVPIAALRGRAATIYYSRDESGSGVRWDRIGAAISGVENPAAPPPR